MKIPSRPTMYRALLALVAAAVLCAQWVGPRHRIEHADRLGTPALLWQHAGHGGAKAHADAADAIVAAANGADARVAASTHEPAPWHDCAAFDAAALGDGPPAAAPACPLPPSSAAPVAARVSPARAAPQALGYLSRAPPRA